MLPVFGEVRGTSHNGRDIDQANSKSSQDRIEDNEERDVVDIAGCQEPPCCNYRP